MNQFWTVTVQLEIENDRGRVQKVKENYLVDAVSATDAEAKIYKELYLRFFRRTRQNSQCNKNYCRQPNYAVSYCTALNSLECLLYCRLLFQCQTLPTHIVLLTT